MAMDASTALKWAAQVITFYHPDFWSAETSDELQSRVDDSPVVFFDRLFDSVRTTGVDYVELCMQPGDWKTALRAYGSASGVVEALGERSLRLSGSYQSGWILEAGMADQDTGRKILDDLRRHAEFLAACGCDILMSGPPRRGSMEPSIALPVSDRSMASTARIMSSMGEATREFGIRLAIHTEAYSCVCREDDIDRIMALTDPSIVYLCPDFGHIALDGGVGANITGKHASRITNMHFKDCIGERSDVPGTGVVTHAQMMEQFRRMGEGIVDWRAIMETLRDNRVAAFAVAEIDLAPDPIDATRDILDYFDANLAEIYR